MDLRRSARHGAMAISDNLLHSFQVSFEEMVSTFPETKCPAIVMPSGGVKRGLERPAILATGRRRRPMIRIEVTNMVHSCIAESR